MADKERLSAFMDGETVDDALIAELEQELESQEAWKNYHLIGDVMRGETPSWDISASVAAALDAEPAHSLNVSPHIESQPTPEVAKKTLPRWLTQFGQVAVAACVSLAVILSVQQYGGSSGSDSSANQLPVLQTIPLAGSVEPVSLTRESVVSKQSNEAQLLEQRRRINAMLQDYELQLRLSSEKAVENGIETQSVIE